MKHGFASKFWGTFRQWQLLGCKVQKRPDHIERGEWGARIVFYRPVTKTVTDPGTGEQEDERFFVMRTYSVFNADQVLGAERFQVHEQPVSDEQFIDFEPAENVIAATGADIRHGGDRAVYALPRPVGSFPNHSDGDYIMLPHKQQFTPIGSYYETLFHELAHWSEVRVGWDRAGEGYAQGELIAEIASSFLSTELGVPQSESLGNHASYLRTWLKEMKDDPKYIFQASRQASKVADYLLSFVRQEAEPVAVEA